MSLLTAQKIKEVERKRLSVDFRRGRSEVISHLVESRREVYKDTLSNDRKLRIKEVYRKIVANRREKKYVNKMHEYGLLKNEALKWGGHILTAGKEIRTYRGTMWGFVAGAGGMFVGAGVNYLTKTKQAMKTWTDTIIDVMTDHRVNRTVERWWRKDREEGDDWVYMARF